MKCPECKVGKLIITDDEIVCNYCGYVSETFSPSINFQKTSNPRVSLHFGSETLRMEDVPKIIGRKNCGEVIKILSSASKHFKKMSVIAIEQLKKLGFENDYLIGEVVGRLIKCFVNKLDEELKNVPEGFLETDLVRINHKALVEAILSLVINNYKNRVWICIKCKKRIDVGKIFIRDGEVYHEECIFPVRMRTLLKDAMDLIVHFSIPKVLQNIFGEKKNGEKKDNSNS